MSEVRSGELERVPSGVPGLDIILSGGFLKGGLYIIQGPPGTGKTTFGNQVCFHHVASGGRALYVTLLAEYHARMMQHLGVMTFFDGSKIPDQLTYLNGLSILKSDGLKGLLSQLRREITRHNVSVLVLDGIVSAKRVSNDEQAFNGFVHELQAVAIASGCTMFMLTSAAGERVTPEHTMVDGIVELSDQLIGWAAQSCLQVVKFRGSAFLRGRHAFKITDDGIIVHPRIEALLARPSRPDQGGLGRVSSGVDQLDVMLGGGLPDASTSMVMGPSGTGKTTLGLQFLSRCSETEPGLLFGFYETLPVSMPRLPRSAPRCATCSIAVWWKSSGSPPRTTSSTLTASAFCGKCSNAGRGGCSSMGWGPFSRRREPNPAESATSSPR
jgi:circadian clock protein KaiC